MKKRLTLDDFEEGVQCTRVQNMTRNSIRLNRHHIHTYQISKIGLSGFGDILYILDNGISTLAYGHHRTVVDSF